MHPKNETYTVRLVEAKKASDSYTTINTAMGAADY